MSVFISRNEKDQYCRELWVLWGSCICCGMGYCKVGGGIRGIWGIMGIMYMVCGGEGVGGEAGGLRGLWGSCGEWVCKGGRHGDKGDYGDYEDHSYVILCGGCVRGGDKEDHGDYGDYAYDVFWGTVLMLIALSQTRISAQHGQ